MFIVASNSMLVLQISHGNIDTQHIGSHGNIDTQYIGSHGNRQTCSDKSACRGSEWLAGRDQSCM